MRYLALRPHYLLRSGKLSSFLLLFIVLLTLPTLSVFSQICGDNFYLMDRNARSIDLNLRYSELWAESESITDILVTDAVPGLPGKEIFITTDMIDKNGYVKMISGNGDGWRAESLYREDFNIKSIAEGDIYPGHDGAEIVVAGFNGFAVMLYFDVNSDKWYTEELFKDFDLLHDVAVGDIDPDHPGDEIVTVGESRRLSYIYYDESTDTWQYEIIRRDHDFLNVVTVAELDSSSKGAEIITAGGTKNVTIYSGVSGSWSYKTILQDSSFIQEVEVVELVDTNDAPEVLVAGFSNQLKMVYYNESGAWQSSVLLNDESVINDVIVGDYSDKHDGLELLAVGSSGKVELIYRQDQIWYNTTVHRTSRPPVRIVQGDFDLFHSGPEIVLSEFKGRLTGLYIEQYDFSLVTPLETYDVLPGETFQLDLLAISNGGFKERVHLSVEGAYYVDDRTSRTGDPLIITYSVIEYFDFDYESSSLVPTDFTGVSITIAEDYPYPEAEIEFLGASEDNRHYLCIKINLIDPGGFPESIELKPLDLDLEPRVTYITADYSTTILVRTNGGADRLVEDVYGKFWGLTGDETPINFKRPYFTIENAPVGLSILSDDNSAKVTDGQYAYLRTLRADSGVPVGTFNIFIKIHVHVPISESPDFFDDDDDFYRLERGRVLQLKIESVGTPDFLAEVSPGKSVILHQGENFTFDVGINEISGFDKDVQIRIDNPNPALETELDRSTINRFEKAELRVTPVGEVGYTANLILTLNYKDRYRFEIVRIIFDLKDPSLNLTLEKDSVEIDFGGTAVINITLTPRYGFEGNVILVIDYIDDGGGLDWRSRDIEENVNEIEIIQVAIDDFKKAGMYNFSAFIKDVPSNSLNFSVTVSVDVFPGNDKNQQNGQQKDEDKVLDFQQQMLLGMVIILVIIAIGSILLRSKRAPVKPDGIDSTKQGGLKTGSKLVKQKRTRGVTSSKLLIDEEIKKPVHKETPDKKTFELGTKVFKPGGMHEFDDLNNGSNKKDK